MKWFITKVKLPAFTPLRVLVLLIIWCLVLWVGLLAVSIMLLAYLPKTIVLVLLVTAILLIGLFVQALLAIELWALWRGYTKTMTARGRETSLTFGGEELSTYETWQTESSILSLSALARYADNTEHQND